MTLEAVLESLPAEERLILPCLQRIQQAYGYVPDSVLDGVAEFLNVSRAEVVGVLTFYHDLRRAPAPPVVVSVCRAEACQAQGARTLCGDIERTFGVGLDAAEPSATTEFRTVFCLGNCALGPAVMVNGRLLGRCDIAVLEQAVAQARGEAG